MSGVMALAFRASRRAATAAVNATVSRDTSQWSVLSNADALNREDGPQSILPVVFTMDWISIVEMVLCVNKVN
jgi:hypothetical protein